MADAPNSFSDPFWSDLAGGAEQRHGLPPGLLVAVLTKGEKSNADQVSEAGAKTPFQVTPTTRDLILKRDGIDAYLNPRNAADAAALVLKDGMKWAQGRSDDPAQQAALAAGYYHAGGDLANWGPRTRSYIERVSSALLPVSGAALAQAPSGQTGDVQLPAMQGPSTFDKALAQMQSEQAPSQLQQIYQAYRSGQMSPQEQQDFEEDVRAGKMALPRGATLKSAAADGPGVGGAVAGAQTPVLPAGVLQAYQSGQMSPQEMADLNHDVRGGAWQLPAGMTADSLFGAPQKPQGLGGQVADAVTGSSRSTPQIEAAPDWTHMPSLDAFGGHSVGVGTLLKIAGGTLLSNPQETAQILQANIPGLGVHQDQKGNYLFTDPADGNTYAYKPGFRASDIPRAIGGALAFTPAGRMETVAGGAVANAGTQAIIEGAQYGAGGNFDTHEVATAGALGAAVPVAGRVLDAVAQPVKALTAKVLGRAEPALADARAAATPGGAAEAGAPAAAAHPPAIAAAEPGMTVPGPAAPGPYVRAGGAAAAPGSVEGVAQTAQQAAKKGVESDAARELAQMAAPDKETLAAADRLGVQGALQSDHVTTNDAYRQTLGILKSMSPVSDLSKAEREGLEQVSKRASDLIEEIGGSTDLQATSNNVKSRMQAAHTELSARESGLWDKLRESIPATTETPATSTLAFLEQRAKELGSAQNLSPFERTLVSKLTPKGGGNAEMLNALGPAAKQQALEQGAAAVKQPTYALLDDLRRSAGRMGELNTAFSDADTGLARKLYGLLSSDQEAIANSLGQGDLAAAAKAATVTRKSMEDDLTALFGKRVEKAMGQEISGGMKVAATGNAAPLLAVLKATPDSLKQEVVASGLASMFRTAATRGDINFTTFAKWFSNLQRNKQAYTAVMSNLPPPARQQILDLARVSKGISDSLATRIGTGRLNTVVAEAIKAPDTLASRLFEVAKHAGKGLAADAVGGHGAGLAMGLMSAMKGNAKSNATKAIDELLTSPEFQHLAATAGTPKQGVNVRAFAYSKSFTAFARAVGNPRELSNREKWVLEALQTRRNTEH